MKCDADDNCSYMRPKEGLSVIKLQIVDDLLSS